MKLHSLEIHNILSIEHAAVTFGDSGLVLVEGFDYDTGRANGAGKSAIFNALSFALYDKVPRRVTKSEILRKGTKRGYSHVTVQTSSGTYAVKRERPISTTFYKDGKEIDITQGEFEEKIGLNYEQFLTTMYTAQDNTEKFINLNDSQKKNFILKIMNLGKFTKAKAQIVEDLRVIETEQAINKTKLNGYKSNIEIYKSSMVDPTNINNQLNQINEDIEAYTLVIKRQESIAKPDSSKYIDVENKIQQQLLNVQAIKVKCQSKREELKLLQSSGPNAECPHCEEDLKVVGGSVSKVDKPCEDTISAVIQEINNYEIEIAREKEIKDFAEKVNLKKQEEYADFNTAQSSISEHRTSIRLKEQSKVTLQAQLQNNEEIKKKATLILTNTQALNKRQSELLDEQFLLDAVGSVFDATGAPAYVMDAIVDSLNEAVSEYISEIWPNATYSLQTYKTNKDKSIKAKFSETLTINGKDRSIGSLSGGEARALSLALDFAIVEVLSSQYGLSLNPVILDEAFNGLDTVGKEIIMDLLIKFSLNRQVWVIDHSSEFKTNFNQVVRVEKRNGVSKIA